jgi:hypothetical protein
MKKALRRLHDKQQTRVHHASRRRTNARDAAVDIESSKFV